MMDSVRHPGKHRARETRPSGVFCARVCVLRAVLVSFGRQGGWVVVFALDVCVCACFVAIPSTVPDHRVETPQ